MLWNDDVQAPANRFGRRIVKQIDCGVVLHLNHSLSVCEDDGIWSLVNDQPKNL